KADELIAAGAKIQIISESAFLELKGSAKGGANGKPKAAAPKANAKKAKAKATK
ncbi:MAG: hypothetical protein K0S65_3477, partial [Labilithrix sp.]|nr:hypothetical protein [Labilithrix sp.]